MDVVHVIVEALGPIALVAMLSSAFGALTPRIASEQTTQLLLGALFGAVAFLLMHAPIEPFPGMIVDLRNIPIALAGAFLGVRGLLICLAIAIACRIGIGGIGAVAGVAAMTIAGLAGCLWADLRRHAVHASWMPYLLLSLMMSSHLFAVVLLPKDLAIWFLTYAALPILGLNIICVTLVAALFDREMRHLDQRMLVDAARRSSADGLLLTEAQFRNEIAHHHASDGADAIAGLLVLRLHYTTWIKQHWGLTGLGLVLGAVRVRLRSLITHPDVLGLSRRGAVLVPLTQQEVDQSAALIENIERQLTSKPVEMGRGERTRLQLSCAIRDIHGEMPRDARATVRQQARTKDPVGARRVECHEETRQKARQRAGLERPHMSPSIQADLFWRADRLMSLRLS